MLKTKSEQAIEQLESLGRPLTDDESRQLERAMHAVYERNRRLSRAMVLEREIKGQVLDRHREEEAEILRAVEAEAELPDWHDE